jgi:murein DD-endopeptidase MepM/ murein hydrolase activator NlpD
MLGLRQAQFAHQRALVEASQLTARELDASSKARNRQLARLSKEQATRREAITETERLLAESQAKLRAFIAEIERQRRTEGRPPGLPEFDFAGHRGRLPAPARGPIVSRYGRTQDPELKTWTFNRGVDIAARQGGPVRAVAPGEVMMVDWFRGYGQFVLLRHPGGYYSLYGHLDSRAVATGDILSAGDVVGTVGSTGRLDGASRLHFEIMKGEEALDPALWIAGP